MTDLPAPLVPADADLKDFAFTPIYRARLFGSAFHSRATDAEWRAGVTLWLRSQDQVPAGSLPDDDIDLCRLAELGRDVKTWQKIREGALRGWFKCNDGRLYHKVVAEVVLSQWTSKRESEERREKWREKKKGQRDLSPGTNDHVPRENPLNRQGQGELKGQGEVSLNGETHDSLPRESSPPNPNPNPSAGGFWEFWTAYPLKTGRKDGLRAYADACNRASHEVILAGAQRYALSREDQDPKFTKSAQRWLEGDCWNDEAPPPKLSDAERIAREIEGRA